MVALFNFVSAAWSVVVASQLVGAVPTSGPSVVVSELMSRQLDGPSPISPSSVQPQCQSSCNVVLNTLNVCRTNPSSLECLCTDSIMDGLGSCLGCEAGLINDDANTKQVQSFMDSLVAQCKAGGFPVKSETIVAKKSGALKQGPGAILALGGAAAVFMLL